MKTRAATPAQRRFPWRSCRTRCRGRRGAILLQVAFLFLAVMGLLAVVVDLGIARATQAMMQVSADVAAMEALRFRDAEPDPVLADAERRAAAARAAELVFDDDLVLGTDSGDFLLGAGPQLSRDFPGTHDLEGGVIVKQLPYRPELQLNAANNFQYGDLVAGTFTATNLTAPGDPDWHEEAATYARADFEVASAAEAPGSNAVLARLRRTRDLLDLDRQPGISSAGPTLPFLFGLGTATLMGEDPDRYDPRRDGITVRATSIADARPVLAAGVMSDLVTGLARVGEDASLAGLPWVLAIDDEFWIDEDYFTTGEAFVLHVFGDRSIELLPGGVADGEVGIAQRVQGLVRVGDAALSLVAPGSLTLTLPAGGLEGLRYLALYDVPPPDPDPDPDPDPVPPTGVITGFAAIEVTGAVLTVNAEGVPLLEIQGQKLPSSVAPENASAVPSLATDVAALMPHDPRREALLAPVLAR